MAKEANNSARKVTKSSNNIPSKHDQFILNQEIGFRMKESRDMTGLSQQDASRRFGYQSSSRLSKVEKGALCALPVWLLRRACIEYDVSADYLLGVTETMERDDVSHASLREMHAFLFANFDKRHAQDIAMLESLRRRIEKIEEFIVLASMQVKQLEEARKAIGELEEYQDIKGGNQLLAYIDRLNGTVNQTASKFKDLKREMQIKAGTEFQMNLLLDV